MDIQNTVINPSPYTESGMDTVQETLRGNSIDTVNLRIISASEFISEVACVLGYADNGIGAVICYVEDGDTTYAMKISSAKNLRQTFELHKFLEDHGFRYSVEVYEYQEVKYNDVVYECIIMEFVDAIRASHTGLSDEDKTFLFSKLGRVLGELHNQKADGYGPITYVGNIVSADGNLLEVLNALVADVDPDETLTRCMESFVSSDHAAPVLAHHDLGLQNVFYLPVSRDIKVFDFKPQLLPREFDLAMFIVWNRWLGEEYIDMFLDSYGRQNYDSDLLNKALYIEYKRKLATWYKRVKNSPKAQLWIDQGEREIQKLKFTN